MSFTDFRGAAKRIDDIDIPRLAARISCGEDHLHVFIDVESSGSGFDELGRPKMLFEKHVFWRCLPTALRATAERQGPAYPKWKPGQYPLDSYPVLKRAMAIDETAALKAASWGLTQILGENHQAAGYDTPQEMVLAFMEDEEAHLESTIRVLVSMGIDDDLAARRWEAVARAWNGPGYGTHNYHGRMAKAFAKWAKIRDTSWTPDDVSVDDVEPDGKLAKYEVEAVQKRLRDLGFYEVGKIDGVWGSRTTAAIAAFQHEQGLMVDGVLGPKTKAALATAQPRKVSMERQITTLADLRAQGSTTIQQADSISTTSKVVGWVSLVATIVAATADHWDEAAAFIGPLQAIIAWVPTWAWPLIVVFVALYMGGRAELVKQARLQAERSGMHAGEPDPAPSPPVEHGPEPAQGLGRVGGATGPLITVPGLPFPIPNPAILLGGGER
jgi:hypothetical protein